MTLYTYVSEEAVCVVPRKAEADICFRFNVVYVDVLDELL